ncbi:MAG: hypothetical protein ABIF01_02420 [Candidatus Micrarchaeota archaeon]
MAKKPIEEEVEMPQVLAKGPKPDFRVVQAERGLEGQTKFRSVGGMWRKTSKSGNEFYSMSIGKLRLLVFPNEKA